MQEKFEQKLNQEEQKIEGLVQKEKGIVQVVAPSSPEHPAMISPVVTISPVSAPPAVEYKKAKVVSDDEQSAAITRHNREVFEYEQQQHQKVEAQARVQQESIDRDRQFHSLQQKITTSRKQGVYEETQKISPAP